MTGDLESRGQLANQAFPKMAIKMVYMACSLTVLQSNAISEQSRAAINYSTLSTT